MQFAIEVNYLSTTFKPFQSNKTKIFLKKTKICEKIAKKTKTVGTHREANITYRGNHLPFMFTFKCKLLRAVSFLIVTLALKKTSCTS